MMLEHGPRLFERKRVKPRDQHSEQLADAILDRRHAARQGIDEHATVDLLPDVLEHRPVSELIHGSFFTADVDQDLAARSG